MTTLFDTHEPQNTMTLSLHVPRRTYAWVASLKQTDIKQMRPSDVCDKGKAKEQQHETYTQVQAFKQQEVHREGEFMTVYEEYAPPRSGFPGRLYSRGSQNLWGPLRALRHEKGEHGHHEVCSVAVTL